VTIRPGISWGSPGPLAPDAAVFAVDAEARQHLQQVFDRQVVPSEGPLDLGELGLLAGDLHRTLGSPRHDERALRAGEGMRLPVDVGLVEWDGGRSIFLAHLVAHPRRPLRWWTDRTVAVMNAEYYSEMDLAPRSHPNDGRLDLLDGSLPRGQRLQGRRRARSGTHIPHPRLALRSGRAFEIRAAGQRPLHLWLDGSHVGTTESFTVTCIPDALVVVA
jgi:hypothetical protein